MQNAYYLVAVGATRQREISRLCAPGQVVASSECGAKGDGVACACDTGTMWLHDAETLREIYPRVRRPILDSLISWRPRQNLYSLIE